MSVDRQAVDRQQFRFRDLYGVAWAKYPEGFLNDSSISACGSSDADASMLARVCWKQSRLPRAKHVRQPRRKLHVTAGGIRLTYGRVRTAQQTLTHVQPPHGSTCVSQHIRLALIRAQKTHHDVAVPTHRLQAGPDSRRNSRQSLEGTTPPSLQTRMRWVSPSATPTSKVAVPRTDVAVHSGLGVNSGAGAGAGSGSAAAWDAESDQESPVDPRKVGDLCFSALVYGKM